MLEQESGRSINFTNFADWCKHFDTLSEAARHTVEVLLEYAGTSDIDEANRILSNSSKLKLDNKNISEITPLQSLTHLTYLNLYDNQILDIKPLEFLSNLTELELGFNKISNTIPLQSLTNLTELGLSYNQIFNIKPLQSLTHLNKLRLGGNPISNIKPLRFLTNLTDLDLQSTEISDLAPLQSLTNLTSLCLGLEGKPDLTPLYSLTHLTSLCLDFEFKPDLTPLQSLTNLTRLSVSMSQISDITPLQSLTNLTELCLSWNEISDITPLQSLTNLTSLDLGNNQISDITPLQFLTNLTALSLYTNQISDITLLKSLTNLTALSVNLTGQQKTQFVACCQKWVNIAKSSQQIERNRNSKTLKQVCEIIGLSGIEITLCSSPYAALAQLQTKNKLPDNEFKNKFIKQVESARPPFSLIRTLWEFWEDFGWEEQLFQELKADFPDWGNSEDYSGSIVTAKSLVKALSLAEFSVSSSGMILEPKSQKFFEAIEQLLAEFDWIFTCENVCYACSHPIKLSLDSEYKLHGEGASAIEFADSYKIYSHHGVTLPEKYGAIHPDNWQLQWIFSEKDAKLRRVLIQGIKFDRLCEELGTNDLNSWQEYNLLKIDNADVDPIYSIVFSSFAGWCKHFDRLSEAAKHTIHVLLDKAGTSDINEANRWLLNKKELDLSRSEISDITPLTSLNHLTHLNLSKNRISDITPLRSLTNLWELNLSGNQISEITPLRSLANLRKLNLRDNQISDITILPCMNELYDLDCSLTKEQKSILEASCKKWQTVAQATDTIDIDRAQAAIKSAYKIFGFEAPDIIFCDNHEQGLERLVRFIKYDSLERINCFNIAETMLRKVVQRLVLMPRLECHISEPIMAWEKHLYQIWSRMFKSYWNWIEGGMSRPLVTRQSLVTALTIIDFYTGYLGISLSSEQQKIVESMQRLLAECGWIFMFENTCIACDRPIKLSLDRQSRLHALGDSAIEFSDGYKIYAYHGVTLPEQYGRVHPDNWQAQWLLSERNAELRRILIQVIGYARICEELQAVELDKWATTVGDTYLEYTVLGIEADIDGLFERAVLFRNNPRWRREDVYLLKMTCPSTGFIHFLRVPPNVRSARDAIRWVNWGIDPEDFSIQT